MFCWRDPLAGLPPHHRGELGQRRLERLARDIAVDRVDDEAGGLHLSGQESRS